MSKNVYLARELGKCIINQLNNWPTSNDNIKKTCQIFEALNKVSKSDLIVEGFDPNCEYYKLCADYAYVTQALIQRGIMNLTYYSLLDEFIKNKTHAKLLGGVQDGGMKKKDLLNMILLSFLLLGVSEGSQSVNMDSTAIKTNTNNVDLSIFASSNTDAISIQDLNEMRKQTAKQQLNELIEIQPWNLDALAITIATDISKEQAAFIKDRIDAFNSRLSSSSKTAREECMNLVQDSNRMGIFNNKLFIDEVETLYEKETENATSGKTSDNFQDATAYGVNAVTNIYTAVSRGFEGKVTRENPIDTTDIFQKSYAIVANNRNRLYVEQVEEFSMSSMYQYYCRSSPNPQFILNTSNEDDKYSIDMRTVFGNNNTGTLLLYHFNTIQRIKSKMSSVQETSQEFKSLQSLLEKMQVQIQLIESSALFAPLDSVSSTIISLENTVSEADTATKKYEDLVDNLLELFPITNTNFEKQQNLRKQENIYKKKARQQFLNEWQAFGNDIQEHGNKVLEDAVKNAGKAANIVMEGVADVADDAVKNVIGVADNAANKLGDFGENVIDQGARVGKKALNEGVSGLGILTNGIASNLKLLFPIIVSYGGIAMGAAFFLIWFKKNIFTFSRNAPLRLPPIESAPLRLPPIESAPPNEEKNKTDKKHTKKNPKLFGRFKNFTQKKNGEKKTNKKNKNKKNKNKKIYSKKK